MKTLLRYARLLVLQLKMSLISGMQYRADFIPRGFISLVWLGVALIPLVSVFQARPSVAGWTYPEALVVVGWFTLLKAVLEGAISPSLTSVVEHVRKGT